MIKKLWLKNLQSEKNISCCNWILKKHFSESATKNVYINIKDNIKENLKEEKKKAIKDKSKIKEELKKNSFFEYFIKTDICLKLHDLKIYNPTEIQKNVIPLLLNTKSENDTSNKKWKEGQGGNENIYNTILKNRSAVNNYLKETMNIQQNFYNNSDYSLIDNEKKDVKKKKEEKPKDLREMKKCFNDVYLIVSPEKTGKTLSYFIPIINNFYIDNEKRMNYLKAFYQFLNKYNYKKYRNKLLRKKEKLRTLKRKDNIFFDISYKKYKINNRYIQVRTFKNYNTNNYVQNKRNNALNCLKHKKNISVPFAIILTSTRESAFELFSYLKNFELNMELLTGGYKNKIKYIKQTSIANNLEEPHTSLQEMSFSKATHEKDYEKNSIKQIEMEQQNSEMNSTESLQKDNTYFMKLKRRKKKKNYNLNYNIDIIIGTPDKILEKVENYKNKHLYNFKFLKYIVIEEADSVCNMFNEHKVKLVLNHIKNYTNMYYYRYCDTMEDASSMLMPDKVTDTIETTKQEKGEENVLPKKRGRNHRKDPNGRISLYKKKETVTFSKENNIEIENKGKKIYITNMKNTIDSNIPIMIFVSATKTVAISDFIRNNIRSKYIQQVININSHNISKYVQHIFINSKNKEKVSLLLELLESEKKNIEPLTSHTLFSNKYIIFCNTNMSVKNLKNILSELKYNVGAIHSEMNFKERTENYRKFRKNEIKILICTNIFSRGLNFDNAKIINYDISNNINDYIYKTGKVSVSSGNNKEYTPVTSFFNKKNTGLVNNIIDKTKDKKQIVFQNLNKKVSKLIKIYSNYYDIIKKKQRKKKKGGRKAMYVAPRRNCLSKQNKLLSKKIYFYNKMNEERKRLIKKGILKPYQKIPRFPNRKVEEYDSNEFNKMRKLTDGSLQIIAKKRKTKKRKTEDDAQYEENTIVLENMPTYEEEAEIKEKTHQKKTYF